MRYEENLSGWFKAMEDCHIHFAKEPIEEDRFSDIHNLIQSGLPTFVYHTMKLSSFLSKKGHVRKIYRYYDGHVVIRVIPTDGRHQRFNCIDKSLEDCYKLLSKKIAKCEVPHYNVIINEYDPAEYSGVLISSPDRLVIEMVADKDLERLSHGHIVPWHAEFSEHFPYSFRKMEFYGKVDSAIKEKMWLIVKSLSSVSYTDGAIPRFTPRLGDFEFLISRKTGKLRFVDYKQIWWQLFDRP